MWWTDLPSVDARSVVVEARGVLSLLSFRAAPVVACAVVTRSASARARCAALALCFGLVGFALKWTSLPLVWLALAYGYFAVLGCCARALSRSLRAGRVSNGAVFALSVAGFVIVPNMIAPPGARSLVMVLGWEMMLSAYSYCVEMAKSDRATSVSDCLFFLLVNPVLVYPDRGTRVAPVGLNSSGLRRTVLGFAVLLAAATILARADRTATVASAQAGLLGLSDIESLRPWGFIRQYSQHSGVASLQIGLISQLGYVVPERYDRPLAASGPLDFWRRWNRYVGGWMQRYVFWPTSLHIARSRLAVERQAASAIGVLATFAVVGALHDLSGYVVGFGSLGRSLLVFGASGVLVLVWEGLSRLRQASSSSLGQLPAISWMPGVLSRVAFWVTALLLFRVWTA